MKEYTSYKLRLRPAILEEAQRCFAQYGIRAVKMDDISKNLGISKRTVYELYDTKEDLLCEVVTAWQEARDKRLQELAAQCDDTMDLLIGALSLQLETAATTNFNFYKDIIKYPKVAKTVKEYSDKQYSYSSQFYAKGVEEGYFLPNVDYDVFSRVVYGTMEMLRSDNRYDNLEYKNLFLGYLYVMIRGLCTSKGMEKIDRFVENNL